MDNQQVIELSQSYLMPTYSPLPVAFVRGEGYRLWDADGNEYLDFVGGISVVATGHCHPQVVAAICQQAGQLMHTSNLYHIPPQARLAKQLVEISCADRCFFCNSGAEANEAAIKLARKWAGMNRSGECFEIITARQSFHGRTLATMTATGQEKYQKAFRPLPPGFTYVPFNDVGALEEAISGQTCAVMLESIQAEGGINVPDDDYLPRVRELCSEQSILLILDEVQTGMGRTGRWFGYEHADITPDIITLAKALGSGFPIGACLAKEEVANAFQPGDHASTFGGNHLACAAALATIQVIADEGLVANAARMGSLLVKLLTDELSGIEGFDHIRGRGLLIAVQVTPELSAKAIQDQCLETGLVVNAMGDDRVRLAPPLIVSEADCRQAVEILADAIGTIAGA
ncbi:MAG: acetylornithine transaminase [Armatimonadetes bacterium]|nr:acetylornithine transaminase [Armatimonadota bacterium]